MREGFSAVVWALDVAVGGGLIRCETSAERRREERVCSHQVDLAQGLCPHDSPGCPGRYTEIVCQKSNFSTAKTHYQPNMDRYCYGPVLISLQYRPKTGNRPIQ
ncbi:hypothetical protein PIB30_045116 [Stylosanthes scabra]|uniref:Secreted protein n=1 Tax=Stylosanthes scabra TaxID=79078 RepID=A0ABU6QGS4_9FABA|nr:hypothetical protein [Stylosanthes scabra]